MCSPSSSRHHTTIPHMYTHSRRKLEGHKGSRDDACACDIIVVMSENSDEKKIGTARLEKTGQRSPAPNCKECIDPPSVSWGQRHYFLTHNSLMSLIIGYKPLRRWHDKRIRDTTSRGGGGPMKKVVTKVSERVDRKSFPIVYRLPSIGDNYLCCARSRLLPPRFDLTDIRTLKKASVAQLTVAGGLQEHPKYQCTYTVSRFYLPAHHIH